MSTDTEQLWHVAVGSTAPFGDLHVLHVTAASEVDAAYRAGIELITKSGVGLEAAGWVIRAIDSESDRQAELAHEADEERKQLAHDEMIDSMYP